MVAGEELWRREDVRPSGHQRCRAALALRRQRVPHHPDTVCAHMGEARSEPGAAPAEVGSSLRFALALADAPRHQPPVGSDEGLAR